jgi:prepilin-type N-terminal cleavage/methylation domain-containing protein
MRPKSVHVRGAFTLVEILVVVIIIGIAGAIIVPQLGSRDDMKASSAARMLMADLIYAQNTAITQQSNQYVRFDVTNNNYAVLDSGMNVLTHPVTHNSYRVTFGPGGTQGLGDCKLASADFVGTNPANHYVTIGFDELGTPLAWPDADPAQTMSSGNVVVQSGTYQLKIKIEPYTGQITVTPQ